MPTLRFKHWIFDYHLVITATLTVVTFIVWYHVGTLQVGSFLIPAVGSILGISYFLFKQKLEETCLFRELYRDFNERYAKMNDRLYDIHEDQTDQSLGHEDKVFLFEYFNLCSEEFLYYRKGYIYPEVWRAWQNGMAIFCESRRIRELWESEIETGSYYGMTLPHKEDVI